MTRPQDAELFVKRDPAAPPGFFEAEARGLRWLGEVDAGVRVVTVERVGPTEIVLERLHPVRPSPAQADEFGRRLAQMHLAPAPSWGSADGDGFIGPLPLPNGPYSTWADLWWHGRVEPYLRASVERGRLDATDAAGIERVVAERCPQVDAPAPTRVHGDLWSGNVVWTAQGAVLLDAASAHGGHHEADLAMLALFGLAHLDRVLAAYDEVHPLGDGWSDRVPLLQLHPLLVHVVLFGQSYVPQVRRAVASLS